MPIDSPLKLGRNGGTVYLKIRNFRRTRTFSAKRPHNMTFISGHNISCK